MILSTHPKQKNVTVPHITVVRYLLEKQDDQIQSNAVNRRLSSHFFAASRAKLKRFLRPEPYPLTFFHSPFKDNEGERERERERERQRERETKRERERRNRGESRRALHQLLLWGKEREKKKFTARKVPGQCPFGLLVKVGWK
jgi:hypothetical protein